MTRRFGRRSCASQHVSNILEEVLKRRDLDEPLRLCWSEKAWAKAVGPDAAQNSRPESFSGSCLVVMVANSSWLQDLSMRRNLILKELEDHMPQSLAPSELRLRIRPFF